MNLLRIMEVLLSSLQAAFLLRWGHVDVFTAQGIPGLSHTPVKKAHQWFGGHKAMPASALPNSTSRGSIATLSIFFDQRLYFLPLCFDGGASKEV